MNSFVFSLCSFTICVPKFLAARKVLLNSQKCMHYCIILECAELTSRVFSTVPESKQSKENYWFALNCEKRYFKVEKKRLKNLSCYCPFVLVFLNFLRMFTKSKVFTGVENGRNIFHWRAWVQQVFSWENLMYCSPEQSIARLH